jgi:hypothetical protein
MNQLEGVDCAQLRYDVEVIQLGKSVQKLNLLQVICLS